jgi:hypothetical protein
MNGGLSSHNLCKGSHTEHEPMYRNKYSAALAPQARNAHLRHSHVPTTEWSTGVSQNRYADTTDQHPVYVSNVRQPLFLTNNHRLYGRSSAAAYYDRIRAQVYYHAPQHSQAKPSTLPRGPTTTTVRVPNERTDQHRQID